MDYFQFINKYKDNILVYIEEYNKQDRTVVFDFLDLDGYQLFVKNIESSLIQDSPSMVLLKNYKGRSIQENTIYAIRLNTIQLWKESNLISSNNLNSFLIGFEIDISYINETIFNESISIKNNEYNYTSNPDMSRINFPNKGEINVVIRDVGQANWNEIYFDNEVKVVYDVGAPMESSKKDIEKIIGDRHSLYKISKPILILSHWDKDHYHSLLGMTDSELKNNFSVFICRSTIPNRTSKGLYDRIVNALGKENVFSILPEPRLERKGPIYFKLLLKLGTKILIYNAQYHKNRNISGLVLTVRSKNNSIILPGDAHYNQISRDILSHLNYDHSHHLVVPHHGGKAGKYTYKVPTLVKLDFAIISVGKNRYGHPIEKYISSLKKEGFTTLITNIKKTDISITL